MDTGGAGIGKMVFTDSRPRGNDGKQIEGKENEHGNCPEENHSP